MTGLIARTVGGALAALILAFPAAGQVSTDRVAADTDWSVFMPPETPKRCWGVSKPKSWTATENGEDVTERTNRGDILLFVSFLPENDYKPQISFAGGFVFAEGSVVTLKVGSSEYEMFTAEQPGDDGEPTGWAWLGSAEADQQVVDALKKGADAVLVSRSSRGKILSDTFSLLGFTAAMTEAENRCGG